MRTLLPLLMCAFFCMVGCHSKPGVQLSYAQLVAQAHNTENWKARDALAGTFSLQLEGRAPVETRFIYEIASGRCRMELADNTLMIWDGQHAWVSPPGAKAERARHTLRFWPFVIALPYRLPDSRVQVADLGIQKLGGTEFHAAKLTFAPGYWDSPDDWYIVYADPRTHLLGGLVYIVTWGKTLAEAEETPYAVTFYNFKRYDDVLIPTEWRFWNWHKTEGLYGRPIGTMRLTNLRYVRTRPADFAKPVDAREDLPPAR